METRIARLEERTQNMREDLDEIKQDVRAIREAVVMARGGGRLLLTVLGLAAAIGAAIGSLLPWLHAKP